MPCLLGLLLYLVVFFTVFVERDGIPSYEIAYGMFVPIGVAATVLVAMGHPRPAVVLSLIVMVVNLVPFFFLFWVLLPQGLILVGALSETVHKRRALGRTAA
ncbi:MAG: hypothetical protein KY455_13895 [Euryarchaeota archaeon]|nr:hypothetical protein [Euryarchaeota archaeon]